MPKPDPKTEVRRKRFQDLCRSKGWFDEDRQRWAVTEIAEATLKPRNKVSDLLNGKGSFGAQIAREIEIAMRMQEYDLEAVETSAASDQGSTVARSTKEQAQSPDDVERYVGDVVNVLESFLDRIGENGREYVSMALANFVKDPNGQRDLVVDILASAMRSAPPPIAPKPTSKAPKKSRATLRTPARPKLEVRLGGGQRTMFSFPTPPLQKIMRDEDATPREQEWYDKLPKPPKVRQ